MKREIYLECGPDRVRMAVVEDGKLCEYAEERAGREKRTGSLYKGRVQRVLSGMQAAFVDIGEEKNAFLPLGAGERLRGGDELLVQVLKDPPGDTKGLRLTREIALPGRFCVLKPMGEGVCVSHKVEAASREQLRAFFSPLCPTGMGLVLRTQAAQQETNAVEAEVRALEARWRGIERDYAQKSAPGLVWREENLALRMLRDVLSGETVRVCAQGQDAISALKDQAPAEILCSCDGKTPIFDLYGLEEKIERATHRRVWLSCGGYLVVDPCEAMTVIDVNSGKYTGKAGLEETAYAVNLEAAVEVARQLRLRDIGGIVVVDFIDMQESAHREGLLAAFREALSADRSKVSLVGLTGLGLAELTRRRLSQPLSETLERPCPLCGGTGRVLCEEEVARRALTQLRRRLAAGSEAAYAISVHPAVAGALAALHAPRGATVYALAKPGMRIEKFALTALAGGEEPPHGAALLRQEGMEP